MTSVAGVIPELADLPAPAKGMMAIRSWFGLNYVLSPTPLPAKAGFPERELTPSARFFAAVFGVREFLMVGMVAGASRTSREALRWSLIASAAVDAFDALAASTLAVSDARARKAGLLSASTAALSGSLAALAATRV